MRFIAFGAGRCQQPGACSAAGCCLMLCHSSSSKKSCVASFVVFECAVRM